MTSGFRVFVAFLVLLVPVGAANAAAAGPSMDTADQVGDGPRIENATVQAGGGETVRGNTTVVWLAGNHTLTANLSNSRPWNNVELCARAETTNNTTAELGCTPAVRNGTANISFGAWPGEDTGPQNVTFELRSSWNRSEVYDERTVAVYVMTRDGDVDTDALDNARELKLGTDPLSSDTDTDGVPDGAEVDTYGTDPLDEDTDGDGLLDAAEVSGPTNATKADSDGDGLLDGPEVNEYGTDPTEANSDEDALSDGDEVLVYHTDPLVADTDGDGLRDGAEVNRFGTDPLARDTDGDFLSDRTEVRLGLWPTSPFDVAGVVAAALLATVLLVRAGLSRLDRRPTGDDGTAGDEADRRVHRDRLDASAGDESPAAVPDGSTTGPDGPGQDTFDLVTDEERVLRLLYDNDGTMPQKRVADETGWSASKVSRLLSSMSNEGKIRKITIGRENVIRLTDEEDGENDAE